jgi:hypothetical protein
MQTHDSVCDHCGSAIQVTSTLVAHGGLVYCCANCSAAEEQEGSGSDPHAGRRENDLRCRHCGTAISDESSVRSMESDAFCCDNCYLMAA